MTNFGSNRPTASAVTVACALRVLARGPTLTLDLLVKTWKARPVVQAQRVG